MVFRLASLIVPAVCILASAGICASPDKVWLEAEDLPMEGPSWGVSALIPSSGGAFVYGSKFAAEFRSTLQSPLKQPYAVWVRVLRSKDPRQCIITVDGRESPVLGRLDGEAEGWHWYRLGEFTGEALPVRMRGLGDPPWDAMVDLFLLTTDQNYTPPDAMPAEGYHPPPPPLPEAKDGLPIVTGNLSVNWIQHSPVGAVPEPGFTGDPVPSAQSFADLHKEGIRAYEDYIAWGGIETEPGKWDWSRQIAMADAERAAGMEYDPYLWIHNPPMWLREGKLPPGDPDAPDHYTVLRCVEHNQPTQTFSIFDPATVKWFGRFYREMHKAMGDRIGRVYVGLIGPYAEGNYPLPVFDYLNIGHCHEGYWCGDEYARKAFHDVFRMRYRSLGKLNHAWGTRFASWDAVDFPPEIAAGKVLTAEERTAPKARRRWVDFVEWYHQAIIDFSVDVTKAAMRYFPAEKLKMKPGGSAGGVNPVPWGTYCPGYARAVRGMGVRLQPADCHGAPFGDRWYGTAYRFYGVPLTTEPAGGLGHREFLRRVFMDASNGTSEMFTYEWSMHVRDARQWIHLYRGVPSITDVAVYCPTTWYRMNGSLASTISVADSLRDITDFEVADELLIRQDYLMRSKTRVLVWIQGRVVDRAVLRRVVEWVEWGGILVAGMAQPPVDIEGRDDLGKQLFGDARQTDGTAPVIIRMGQGAVVRLPFEPKAGDREFEDLVYRATYHPSTILPRSEGAPEVDGRHDGVWTAVFSDRLLLYNTGSKPADVDRTWNGKRHRVHLGIGELAEVTSASPED